MTTTTYARRVCFTCHSVGEHEYVSDALTKCANCGNAQPDTEASVPRKPEPIVAANKRILGAAVERGRQERESCFLCGATDTQLETSGHGAHLTCVDLASCNARATPQPGEGGDYGYPPAAGYDGADWPQGSPREKAAIGRQERAQETPGDVIAGSATSQDDDASRRVPPSGGDSGARKGNGHTPAPFPAVQPPTAGPVDSIKQALSERERSELARLRAANVRLQTELEAVRRIADKAHADLAEIEQLRAEVAQLKADNASLAEALDGWVEHGKRQLAKMNEMKAVAQATHDALVKLGDSEARRVLARVVMGGKGDGE